ncbi:MAG: cbb3-type cytochrome c oxidase subunit I [Bacteroidales bacterium]
MREQLKHFARQINLAFYRFYGGSFPYYNVWHHLFYALGILYTIIPRLTGREAPQITIGAHFWLALIGLLFYTFPLMYGSTLRGLMWIDGKPFIESVKLMAPYWLWRAIGGSLMWFAHILFIYNFYVMVIKKNTTSSVSQEFSFNGEKQERVVSNQNI